MQSVGAFSLAHSTRFTISPRHVDVGQRRRGHYDKVWGTIRNDGAVQVISRREKDVEATDERRISSEERRDPDHNLVSVRSDTLAAVSLGGEEHATYSS